MSCGTLTLTHLRGQIVRAAVEFSVLVDGVATLVDPDVVRFKVKVGGAAPTVYVYGVDAGVIRDELGKFHFDIATVTAAADATWYVRVEGSGTYDGAAEGAFKVEAGEFA